MREAGRSRRVAGVARTGRRNERRRLKNVNDLVFYKQLKVANRRANLLNLPEGQQHPERRPKREEVCDLKVEPRLRLRALCDGKELG